jgi:hypothetical protein
VKYDREDLGEATSDNEPNQGLQMLEHECAADMIPTPNPTTSGSFSPLKVSITFNRYISCSDHLPVAFKRATTVSFTTDILNILQLPWQVVGKEQKRLCKVEGGTSRLNRTAHFLQG